MEDNFEWGVLSAADVNAPHLKERIWICCTNTQWQLANSDLLGCDDGQSKIQPAKRKQHAQCDIASSSDEVANASCDRWNKRRNNYRQYDGAKLNSNSQYVANSMCKRRTAGFANSQARKERKSRESINSSKDLANTESFHAQGQSNRQGQRKSWGSGQWPTEPDVGRVANGVAFRVDRLKAIGNGQVPICMATAFNLLRERF